MLSKVEPGKKVGDTKKLKAIEKVIVGAWHRWLDEDNEFWTDFSYWMRFRVKPKTSNNPYMFAECCWTFARRKRSGYLKDHVYCNMNYYLTNDKTFWKYFVHLAKKNVSTEMVKSTLKKLTLLTWARLRSLTG